MSIRSDPRGSEFRRKYRPGRWQTAAQAVRALNLLPPAGAPTRGPKCRPAGSGYAPRDPRRSRLRALVERELDGVREGWERRRPTMGPWLWRYWEAAQRFLSCGLIERGFARFRCGDCGFGLRVAFSCKTRLCPTCVRKRMTLWSEWLSQEVLLELHHRHWVFTIPRELRRHFYEKRRLLNRLSSAAARVLMREMSARCPERGATAGVIAVVQTAGDALTFNPHVHMIATMHCLGPSGRLHRVGFIPYVELSRIWMNAALRLLVNTRCVSREEAEAVRARCPKGFNLDATCRRRICDLGPPSEARRSFGGVKCISLSGLEEDIELAECRMHIF